MELDALEALHPGELARLVTAHLQQFRDENLEEKLAEAREKAEAKLQEAWGQQLAVYQERVEALRYRVHTIAETYQDYLVTLSKELDVALAPCEQAWATLRHANTRYSRPTGGYVRHFAKGDLSFIDLGLMV